MSAVVLVQLLKNDEASHNTFYGFKNPTNGNSCLSFDMAETVKWNNCNKNKYL